MNTIELIQSAVDRWNNLQESQDYTVQVDCDEYGRIFAAEDFHSAFLDYLYHIMEVERLLGGNFTCFTIRYDSKVGKLYIVFEIRK